MPTPEAATFFGQFPVTDQKDRSPGDENAAITGKFVSHVHMIEFRVYFIMLAFTNGIK